MTLEEFDKIIEEAQEDARQPQIRVYPQHLYELIVNAEATDLSNPTNSMRDATQELFNVCKCGLVPFRHVVSFHDWEGAESVEVFKSPDSLVNAPSPKEELELEEFIRDVTQAIPKPKSEVRRKIKTLIHKAAITELNKLPNHTDINLYVRERISELKADNE